MGLPRPASLQPTTVPVCVLLLCDKLYKLIRYFILILDYRVVLCFPLRPSRAETDSSLGSAPYLAFTPSV